MTIDTAAILAARYQKDPSPLKAAVLGQGSTDINPYAALRALQLQKEAKRYEMAQAAMNGQQYQDQPSMVEQALSPTMPQMPQMPPQMQQPQGLPGMQQAQQQPSAGLEGMPVPEGSEEEYAGGGIVAFADEGLVQDDQLTDEMLADFQDQQDATTQGDPNSHQNIAARLPGLLQRMENMKYEPFKDTDYKTAFTARKALLEEGAEPSPYDGLQQQVDELKGESAKNLKQASGIAMLAAARDVMQPGGLARGLAAAGGTYGQIYGQAMQADRAEKRALMSMQFNLSDAKRKERMGLNREAIAAADQARQDNLAAQKFGMDKVKNMGLLASNMARATRPGAAGADKTPKNFDALALTYYEAAKAENNALPEKDRKSDTAVRKLAYKEAASDWAKLPAGEVMDVRKREATTDEKSQTATEADKKEQRRLEQERNKIEQDKLIEERRQKKINHDKAVTEWGQAETARKKAIAEEKNKLKTFNRDYIKGDAKKKREMEEEIDARYPAIPKPVWDEPAAPAPDKTSDASGNKNSTATATSGKVITRADIKATATATGRSEADVEAAAKAKGYKIK